MAQEDRGLVLRGLLLLSAVGVLVLIVLAILFLRPQPPTIPVAEQSPETHIVAVITPSLAPFPSATPWHALQQLGATLPSAPGWDVRYNAAATLARRGSDHVPWNLIREMLDAKQQLRNNRVHEPNGKDVYDEAAARATTLSALRAIAGWHEKRKAENKSDVPAELRAVYALVDKMTESPFIELKVQAEKTRATFFR